MMTGAPRIGVVLSSGGARGVYAHTGFLLALEELGIPVSACAGCSAGAVVGGIAASGADLHAWSETLAHLDPARFWTPDPWPRLAWQLAVRRGRGFVGLSGTEAAVEFCRSRLAVPRFEACRYPFHTLAMSLGRGRKVMFSSGELAPRMLASAAMPLLYRPVEITRNSEACLMLRHFFKEKAMKTQLATTAAILGFAAVSAHTQMSGETG